MMKFAILLFLVFWFPAAAFAEFLVPNKTIRAGEALSADLFSIQDGNKSGAIASMQDIVGLEAKNALYVGRPFYFDDLQKPALVDRNAIVKLTFSSGGLNISTPGRALQRGTKGEFVKVMNLSSRAVLFGIVQADGTVLVENQ